MSVTDETYERIRRVCSILESIACKYAPESNEALAVRDAASAYILVHQRESLRKAYEQLKAAEGGQLSDEMKAKLRRVGIDPDDLDEEIVTTDG
ncbi:MAG: hypothetical protein LLG00_09355 [Planctomycetaceae bacterium]|nr:hypothetical protein [Planctomycetaceae bacterium]